MLVPLAVGDVMGPITKLGSMATSDMPSALAISCAAFSASVCGCQGNIVCFQSPASSTFLPLHSCSMSLHQASCMTKRFGTRPWTQSRAPLRVWTWCSSPPQCTGCRSLAAECCRHHAPLRTDRCIGIVSTRRSCRSNTPGPCAPGLCALLLRSVAGHTCN